MGLQRVATLKCTHRLGDGSNVSNGVASLDSQACIAQMLFDHLLDSFHLQIPGFHGVCKSQEPACKARCFSYMPIAHRFTFYSSA